MLSISILITAPHLGEPATLPPTIQRNIVSLQRAHPELEHRLFFLPELSEIIRSEFGSEVFNAFETLKPFAYKADLARYCLLHHFGGVYADLSYFVLRPLPIAPTRITVFRDFLWSSPWDTSNGVIGAPPRHKAFEAAIDLVCSNVRNRYFGTTALCPTGPAVFGRALASTCIPDEIICGQAIYCEKDTIERLWPEAPLPSDSQIHCLGLGGKLYALKVRNAGTNGLGSFGLDGGNSYSSMWQRGDIYV